jgi:hypothetical protein
MAAYNRCSTQLEQGDFLFVLAEPRRSVLLLAPAGPGSKCWRKAAPTATRPCKR